MSMESIAGAEVGAVYGLIGTLIGGVGVKFLERVFARGDRKLDDATAIRKELWEELNRLRLRIESLEGELDEWREKYFAVLAENTELKIENKQLRLQLEEEEE
jgi:hypothetical protein